MCHEAGGIFYQSYSALRPISLERGPEYDRARQVVSDIALRNSITPAQVVLRWLVQQGLGVIPRSSNPVHLAQNLQVLAMRLSDADMAELVVDDRARPIQHDEL